MSENSINAILTKYSDIVLAVLISSIVGMMIIPMPTFLMDILITINISLAVIILLVSLYATEGLNISSLPTILLITTLYRLGLNISSTRLILLQADAGEVIRAFGAFVVKGNYVVGGVVFLILTIIQFIVIAKGAERVAEVAARFTLDAMPGKQMSIDADLRSGLIDQNEARKRRQKLQRESQFYGAMDGAMKFVKGDAIAGIIITVINIIGGIAIGVLQKGMNTVEALQLYGLLTIGDGLVSQIPALVISTGAGIVVTRVASEDEASHLGAEISKQIFSYPKALIIVSVLLIVLGIIPGLPTIPFFIIAAVIGFIGLTLKKKQKADLKIKAQESKEKESKALIPVVTPISLEIGNQLEYLIEDGNIFKDKIEELRNKIFYDLGAPIPQIRIRKNESIENDYIIKIDEIVMTKSQIYPNKIFCSIPYEQLSPLGIDGFAGENPKTKEAGVWVDEDKKEIIESAGIPFFKSDELMIVHLEKIIKQNASHFIGIQEVQNLLNSLEEIYPALVQQTLPKPITLPLLVEVLKRLVEEGISIRNLKEILNAMLEWAPHEKDPIQLTELVRASLKKQITFNFTKGSNKLPVFIVSPTIEDTIRNSIKKTSSGSYLTIEPNTSTNIINTIKKAVSGGPKERTIILTQPDIRRFLKRLLEIDIPDLAVISYHEIEPNIIIQPIGKIDYK